MALTLSNALAYDPGTNLTTSYTTSFTNTSGNALVVTVWTRYGAAFTSPTDVTYNGVSMTKLKEQDDGQGDFSRVSVWGLASPATGANNIVVSLTGTSIRNSMMVVSLNGADASPFGATDGNGGLITNSNGTFSLTTTQANSWIVSHCFADGTGLITNGSNQTTQANNAPNGYYNNITTQTTTTAGSYTNSWSIAGTNAGWSAAGVEVKSVPSAELKTWNGIAIADIKSFNGIA